MSTTISISVMCSVGSLTCGILSLVLPFIALARRKNALPFAAVSMGLCSLALLGQIFEYNVRVYAHARVYNSRQQEQYDCAEPNSERCIQKGAEILCIYADIVLENLPEQRQ